MNSREVHIGESLVIGGSAPIAIQTMCNTHTRDVEATLAQCRRLASAGSQLIRITVPGLADVEPFRQIHDRLRAEGIRTPLVADIHFSSDTAIAVASIAEKVRINPGNFHPDHETARSRFAEFLEVCRANGTAIRVGVNHGSLGKYITEKFGNTPEAMAIAAMEWLRMCRDADFNEVVVSLKASNTLVMVQAYRNLVRMMDEEGMDYPLHVGVTEAGGGDNGRIKSCIGISALLEEGIGDTIRVSLTEDPENELPVARYLADRYSGKSSSRRGPVQGSVKYQCNSRQELMLEAACDFGKALLDREIDDIEISGTYLQDNRPVDIVESGFAEYLRDEILQGARRRFYRPEYIACPGCGRTMYNLQKAYEEVQAKTAHLKGMVIAVMGCIVNGPGEMADADWGYVGEGGGRVTIYKKDVPVAKHIPEDKAPEELLRLIEASL